jgi:hypothetical protein
VCRLDHAAYVSHLLSHCGAAPVCCAGPGWLTLINTMGQPRSALNPEGVMIYLGDYVHDHQLSRKAEQSCRSGDR